MCEYAHSCLFLWKIIQLTVSFQEYILNSRRAADANKAKGNRHAEIFAMMYADRSRFIEEIMQNTEDACARNNTGEEPGRLLFILNNEGLEIHHNGDIFNDDDLISITTFGRSTKNLKSPAVQIGRFGIGFKSVFAITEQPQIHSGDRHYRICDYEVPDPCLPREPEKGYTTLIFLPFISAKAKQIYKDVRNGLGLLNPRLLLFLNRLSEIRIRGVGRNEQVVSRLRTAIGPGIDKVSLFSGKEVMEEFLLIGGDKNSPGKTNAISLAFLIGNEDQKTICPVNESPVYSYFPTRVHTELKFLVHAHFTTSPHREQISFEAGTAPENLRILEKAAGVFLKGLAQIRNAGYLLPGFFKILPLVQGKENDKVYETIFHALRKELSSSKLIPSADGGFECLDDVMIPVDQELCSLLGPKDIGLLFFKRKWASPVFAGDSFSGVRDALMRYHGASVADVRAAAFRMSLHTDWLHQKKPVWLKSFYGFMSRHPELWDAYHENEYYSLRKKELIPDSRGVFRCPFGEDGRPVLFTEAPAFSRSVIHVIDPRLTSDTACRTFFSAMGLSAPAEVDMLLGLLSSKYSDPAGPPLSYNSDLKKIAAVWKSTDAVGKKSILSQLARSYWVLTDDKNDKRLKQPAGVFLNMPGIKKLTDVPLIHPRLRSLIDAVLTEPGEPDSFLISCGVSMMPLRGAPAAVTVAEKEIWSAEMAPGDVNIEEAEMLQKVEMHSSGTGLFAQSFSFHLAGIPMPDAGSDFCIPPYSTGDLLKIHEWSALYAVRMLKSKPDVRSVSGFRKGGDEFDFVLIKNDGSKEFVNLAAGGRFMRSVPLHMAAWNALLHYFQQGRGHECFLLIVAEAGTKNCRFSLIKNPVEKILKGEIKGAFNLVLP